MALVLRPTDAWAAEHAVVIDEYKPRSPMVISRDFRG